MALCPACNTVVKPYHRLDSCRAHLCACGEYFTTREIVISRGRKRPAQTLPVNPGMVPLYKPGVELDAKSHAAAIARRRIENKKEEV